MRFTDADHVVREIKSTVEEHEPRRSAVEKRMRPVGDNRSNRDSVARRHTTLAARELDLGDIERQRAGRIGGLAVFVGLQCHRERAPETLLVQLCFGRVDVKLKGEHDRYIIPKLCKRTTRVSTIHWLPACVIIKDICS